MLRSVLRTNRLAEFERACDLVNVQLDQEPVEDVGSMNLFDVDVERIYAGERGATCVCCQQHQFARIMDRGPKTRHVIGVDRHATPECRRNEWISETANGHELRWTSSSVAHPDAVPVLRFNATLGYTDTVRHAGIPAGKCTGFEIALGVHKQMLCPIQVGDSMAGLLDQTATNMQ
jgi:hypothetical protein